MRVLMIASVRVRVRVRVRVLVWVGLRVLVVLPAGAVFGHGRSPGRLTLTFTGVTEPA
jgi:hypothetical protein